MTTVIAVCLLPAILGKHFKQHGAKYKNELKTFLNRVTNFQFDYLNRIWEF